MHTIIIIIIIIVIIINKSINQSTEILRDPDSHVITLKFSSEFHNRSALKDLLVAKLF